MLAEILIEINFRSCFYYFLFEQKLIASGYCCLLLNFEIALEITFLPNKYFLLNELLSQSRKLNKRDDLNKSEWVGKYFEKNKRGTLIRDPRVDNCFLLKM